MKNSRSVVNGWRPNIGVVIYTFDRIVDAAVNIELIRSVWTKSNCFKSIKIVHCYNGPTREYPRPTGEDVLIRQKNPGHFPGAANLMDAGVKRMRRYRGLDYLVIVAADTWLLKPEVVAGIMRQMFRRQKPLATCPWGVLQPEVVNTFTAAGMATDFFILDARWERRYRMFPLQFRQFKRRLLEVILYLGHQQLLVEHLAWIRFGQAVRRENRVEDLHPSDITCRVRRLKEREPVHSGVIGNRIWLRLHAWPKLGLYTHHNLKKKIPFLQTVPDADGLTIRSLLNRKA